MEHFRSRRGASLVEEICAAMLLAIVVAGIVGAIAMARVSVSANSAEESASAQAQQIADKLIAGLSTVSAEPAASDLEAAAGAKHMGNSESTFQYPGGGGKQFAYWEKTDTEAGKTVADGYNNLLKEN